MLTIQKAESKARKYLEQPLAYLLVSVVVEFIYLFFRVPSPQFPIVFNPLQTLKKKESVKPSKESWELSIEELFFLLFLFVCLFAADFLIIINFILSGCWGTFPKKMAQFYEVTAEVDVQIFLALSIALLNKYTSHPRIIKKKFHVTTLWFPLLYSFLLLYSSSLTVEKKVINKIAAGYFPTILFHLTASRSKSIYVSLFPCQIFNIYYEQFFSRDTLQKNRDFLFTEREGYFAVHILVKLILWFGCAFHVKNFLFAYINVAQKFVAGAVVSSRFLFSEALKKPIINPKAIHISVPYFSTNYYAMESSAQWSLVVCKNMMLNLLKIILQEFNEPTFFITNTDMKYLNQSHLKGELGMGKITSKKNESSRNKYIIQDN
eukprot:gene12193-8391_t